MAKEDDKSRSSQPVGRGRGMGAAPGEKPKDFKNSIKKLWNSLRDHRKAIYATVGLAIVGTVFSIVTPKILGNMTNQIVEDYVSIKAYGAVTDQLKELPLDIEIPNGTTIEDLPKLFANYGIDLGTTESDSVGMLGGISAEQIETVKHVRIDEKPSMNYEALAKTALVLVGLYVFSALCSYASGWLMVDVTQKVVLKYRRDISEKINRLPVSYFDKHQYGDTLSRITNDVDTVSQSLNQGVSQIITSVTMLIGILVMMLTISWQMTLIALAVLPISFLFIGFITKNSQKHFKNQQNQLGELNGHVEEVYSGQVVVRAFSGEKRATDKFDNINSRLYASSWKSQFLSGLMFPIMNLIGNLGYVASAVTGGWLAINGKISIGDIQAFIQYVSQFNQPIVQVAQIANVLQSTVAAAERVFEFLEEPEEPADTSTKKLSTVRGEVEFKDVVFGYEKGKDVIKGFSAKIKPGQKVAIVGPTGAGKTTVVNLLMRFYDPRSGSITIDGINTRDLQRSEVRKQFGMVLQDTWLFDGTVKDNLAYGNLRASKEDVTAAAKAAHVDHFVQSLPKGYKTLLEEDSENISAGEKQLLTIARAMLANAPMMILDEATSSVDTRTEVLIQEAMERLTEGRTSFIIAHRLSTIKDADLILVMNEGNIIEQGDHETLLEKNGFYANLYNSQFVED